MKGECGNWVSYLGVLELVELYAFWYQERRLHCKFFVRLHEAPDGPIRKYSGMGCRRSVAYNQNRGHKYEETISWQEDSHILLLYEARGHSSANILDEELSCVKLLARRTFSIIKVEEAEADMKIEKALCPEFSKRVEP